MAVLVGVAAVCVSVQGNGEKIAGIADELKVSIYEEILEFYMPGVVYGQSEEKTIAEEVLSHFFMWESESAPVEYKNAQVEPYTTQVESELSYDGRYAGLIRGADD